MCVCWGGGGEESLGGMRMCGWKGGKVFEHVLEGESVCGGEVSGGEGGNSGVR